MGAQSWSPRSQKYKPSVFKEQKKQVSLFHPWNEHFLTSQIHHSYMIHIMKDFRGLCLCCKTILLASNHWHTRVNCFICSHLQARLVFQKMQWFPAILSSPVSWTNQGIKDFGPFNLWKICHVVKSSCQTVWSSSISFQHSLRFDLTGHTVLEMQPLLLLFFLCPVLPAVSKPAFLLEYIDKFEGHSVTLVISSSGFGLSPKHLRQVISAQDKAPF